MRIPISSCSSSPRSAVAVPPEYARCASNPPAMVCSMNGTLRPLIRQAAPMSNVAAITPPRRIAASGRCVRLRTLRLARRLFLFPDLHHVRRALGAHVVVGEDGLGGGDQLLAREHHGFAGAVVEVERDVIVLQIAQ